MKPMRRSISILLCGAMLLALAGCGEKPEEIMDPTVTVEVTVAEPGSLSSEITYIGTVSAEGTASVVAMVSGTVEDVPVSVGDTVTAGQLLCRFDDTSAQLALENAQVAYQQALAGVESAQAGYQTAQAGVGSAQAGEGTAQAGVESAQMSVEIAQAGVESALAALAGAQAALSSAQQSYQGTLANYGGDGQGSLTVLEGQVSLAQDNYDATKALFELGAASQVEVDQAYQNLQTAQAGLQAAQASLAAAQAGVQQAEAAVQQAESGVQQAEANLAAAQTSVQQAQAGTQSAQAGTQSAQAGIETAEAGLQSAQAGVTAAQVGIASAEHQLTLYHLTSPISGVVEAINVTENNFSASGHTAFVISNSENKTVTFYVPEEVHSQLKQGQPVSVHGGGGTYSGAVTEISGVVDARVGLFQVKAIIEGAQDLPDGLMVELTTVSHSVENALLIPCDALYFDNGDAFVYVLRDNSAVRVGVELALYTPEVAAISAGLSAGDQVIFTWSSSLKDGAPVRLTQEAEAAADKPDASSGETEASADEPDSSPGEAEAGTDDTASPTDGSK